MIAIIFPGQGSQKLGMQSELARDFKEIKLTYQEASRELGYDLWKLAQGEVKEKSEGDVKQEEGKEKSVKPSDDKTKASQSGKEQTSNKVKETKKK